MSGKAVRRAREHRVSYSALLDAHVYGPMNPLDAILSSVVLSSQPCSVIAPPLYLSHGTSMVSPLSF